MKAFREKAHICKDKEICKAMQSSNRKTVVTKYCTLINKLLLTLVFIVVQKVLLWGGDMFAANSCWSRIKWPRQWFHFSKVYCKIKSIASKYPDKHRVLTHHICIDLHTLFWNFTQLSCHWLKTNIIRVYLKIIKDNWIFLHIFFVFICTDQSEWNEFPNAPKFLGS